MTSRRWLLLDASERVVRLNRLLVGWSNYFRLGSVSKAYRRVDMHTRGRLRQWLCAKHKVAGRGTSRFPDDSLHHEFGLVRLALRTHSLPWANA